MKHLTTSTGTSYVCTFQEDVGNDLGLEVSSLYYFDTTAAKYIKSDRDLVDEVSSLYYFDTTAAKYIKSDRDLVDVINDAVETHDIPKSRVKEN